MAEERFNSALEDCIARLAEGESVADCVRRYPEYASDLLALLESGLLVQRIQASDAEVAESQARVAERFESALSTSRSMMRVNRNWWRSLSAIAAVFVLFVFINVALAQNSLPGDWNYGIKRVSETVLLLINNNAEQREFLAERRREEVRSLLAIQREADIDFEGRVLALNESAFLLADIDAVIEASPEILRDLEVNLQVMVMGRTTSDGRLLALTVQILSSRTVEPDIVLSPSAVFTETTTVTVSPTPAPTQLLRPTEMPSLVPVSPVNDEDQANCIPSVPDTWIAYSIQSGDSLFELAVRSGASLEMIVRVNCIDDPSLISVGRLVYLPSPLQNDRQSSTDSVRSPTQAENVRATEASRPMTREPVRPTAVPTRGR